MGNANSIQRINFEDLQVAQAKGWVIINTLPATEQNVLISSTTLCNDEIRVVELAIKRKEPIVVYGRHCNDETIYSKYTQIKQLGGQVYLYTGGLFEWILLQDIYTRVKFPCTGLSDTTVDLLKYKPCNILNINLKS